MTLRAQLAEHDLAFMRALVEVGGRTQLTGGAVYLFGGLAYGAQCLLDWPAVAGWVRYAPGLMSAINLLPTVLFAVLLPWWIWRDRGRPTSGAVGRATQAAFGSAGIANLVIVAAFGWAAARERSSVIWELYPVVVFTLQGAVWLSVFMVRRRAWHFAVAAGWFASSIALSAFVGTAEAPRGAYVFTAGLALLAFMAAPGAVMIRLARRIG